jgi:hypothetical protein
LPVNGATLSIGEWNRVSEQKQGGEAEEGEKAHNIGDRGQQDAAGQGGVDAEAL